MRSEVSSQPTHSRPIPPMGGARRRCWRRSIGGIRLLWIVLILGVSLRVDAQLSSPCRVVLQAFPQGTVGQQGDFLSTAIGDLDNDGMTDFVVGGATAGPLSFYFGSGASTLSAEALILGVATRGVEVGDFNEDGNLDVLVATDQPNLQLLLGDGVGGFVANPVALAVAQSMLGLEAGDLNQDGHLDVVLYGSSGLTTLIVVLLGVGDGTFIESPPFSETGAPSSVNLLDWNGDGLLDLILPNAVSGIRFYWGNGSGGFDFESAVAVPTPITVDHGDFNGDGNVDLAVALFSNNQVAVLYGDGLGGVSPVQFVPLAQNAFIPQLVTLDFNGDGFDDLAVTSNVVNAVQTLLSDGSGIAGAGFIAGQITPMTHWTTFMEVADFDNDGESDLLMGRIDALTIMRNATHEQSDCNANGVADACDILSGSSTDNNFNGIPDDCETPFVRGDANIDGSIGLIDAVFMLNFLFGGGPSFCLAAHDLNADGSSSLADIIYELNYVFLGAAPPAFPFPGCGVVVGDLCEMSSCP